MKSFLKTIRLLDADGTLSLTNILMMVLIAKVALLSTLTLSEVSALFMALASYNMKKVFAHKKAASEIKAIDAQATLEAKAKEVMIAASSELAQLQADVKALILQNNMRTR